MLAGVVSGVSPFFWSPQSPFFMNSLRLAFAEGTLALTFAAQGTPPIQPEALSTMDAFLAEAQNITGVTVSVSTYHNYISFGQFAHDNLVEPTKAIGFNYTTVVPGQVQSVTSSWLLPREVTAPENAQMLAELMANVTAVGTPLYVSFLLIATTFHY